MIKKNCYKQNPVIDDILNNKLIESPDKIFIKKNRIALTWLDLEKASQILAYDLYKLGVREGSHVGIASKNSINWIITFFSLCKLNAIPVLLNSVSNSKEIAIASDISDMDYLCFGDIRSKDEINRFIEITKNEENCKIKKVYSISDSIDFRKRFNEYEKIQGMFRDEKDINKSLMYLFTSGSTGIPKVVMHSMESLIYRSKEHIRVFGFNSSNKFCLVLPLFHIFALYTIFFPSMICNGEMVLPEDNRSSTIIRTIYQEKCTNFNSVPTLMLAILSNNEFKEEYFNSVKLSIIGGAVTSTDQFIRFREQMPNTQVVNGYGLTEACPVTHNSYEDGIDNLTKTVGRPYDGIEVNIKDNKTNKFCLREVVGEIVIKGYSTMVGYYNASNDEPIDEDGWLHTGDLGYITKQGYLCVSGRIKEIIIRNGENIMPQEVASALIKNESINEVKVFGIPDEFRGEEIVACVTMKNNCVFNKEETIAIMSKYISAYKMPKYYFVYDELPKLGTGKIDVIKLKKDVEGKLKA